MDSALRERLVPRFHPGHTIWALLDAEDYAGAADSIKAHYSYEHPLEAQVRALGGEPVKVAAPEPEPEVSQVTAPEVVVETVEEESEPDKPLRSARANPRRGK